jgi:transcription initiation factor IIF auxiliary subunit
MKAIEVKKSHNRQNYTLEQSSSYQGDDWWKWSLWVEASSADLDKIDHVVYNLHFTFHDPVRIMKNRIAKFKMDTEGWGTFTIYARLHFKDESVLDLEHCLELLYPDGEESEA